jgi:hypothetical protein
MKKRLCVKLENGKLLVIYAVQKYSFGNQKMNAGNSRKTETFHF